MDDRQTAVGAPRPVAAEAPVTQRNSRSSDYIAADEVIPPLAASLALVRPVGMGEEAAAEWLAVAASELAGYNRASVLSALSEARRRCNHHGQIIPFVIKEMEDRTPWRMGKPLDRQLPPQAECQTLPPPRTQVLIESASKSLNSRE